MSEQPADFDSPWKDVLDEFFEQCVAFFFPPAHAQIDWARGYEFLDKELQQITADAAIGRRIVDKLVKVWLRSGDECWLLVHLEVQGEREVDFETRLYVYNFRSFDRFNARVATFVILTDEDKSWRPSAFSYEVLGTTVSLQFTAAKLLDYRERSGRIGTQRQPFCRRRDGALENAGDPARAAAAAGMEADADQDAARAQPQ